MKSTAHQCGCRTARPRQADPPLAGRLPPGTSDITPRTLPPGVTLIYDEDGFATGPDDRVIPFPQDILLPFGQGRRLRPSNQVGTRAPPPPLEPGDGRDCYPVFSPVCAACQRRGYKCWQFQPFPGGPFVHHCSFHQTMNSALEREVTTKCQRLDELGLAEQFHCRFSTRAELPSGIECE